MDLSKVIFLGGNSGFASVKVRCADMASYIGCDCLFGKHYAHDIPDKYSIFVCVKTNFSLDELAKLARRGLVIWDIIDALPPRDHVALYLASTEAAKDLFIDHGRVEVIPHYHCNISRVPNSSDLRRPAWIGSCHWLPQFK